jgi:hypothetical protein
MERRSQTLLVFGYSPRGHLKQAHRRAEDTGSPTANPNPGHTRVNPVTLRARSMAVAVGERQLQAKLGVRLEFQVTVWDGFRGHPRS